MFNDTLTIDPANEQASPAPELADEMTLQLRKPITLGPLEYTELKLTEPTVKQLRIAGKAGAGIDQLAQLIQHVAAVPSAVVDQMSQRDFEACASFFDRFGTQSP